VKVSGDGRNLLSHAGLRLLAEVADRTGLTRGLSEAMATCGIGWRTHDPGVVLVHVAASIAGGGRFLSDLEGLRHHDEVYGPVASVPTAWRALGATACTELRAIPRAVAAARAKVWAQSPPEGLLVLDFDATLVDAHTEKEDAAATYKRGFGFHPLGSWCDNTREPLAVLQRAGNAGSNDADDHCELLDETLAALPPDYQAGHQIGEGPDHVGPSDPGPGRQRRRHACFRASLASPSGPPVLGRPESAQVEVSLHATASGSPGSDGALATGASAGRRVRSTSSRTSVVGARPAG
jgi:hypothetical protein